MLLLSLKTFTPVWQPQPAFLSSTTTPISDKLEFDTPLQLSSFWIRFIHFSTLEKLPKSSRVKIFDFQTLVLRSFEENKWPGILVAFLALEIPTIFCTMYMRVWGGVLISFRSHIRANLKNFFFMLNNEFLNKEPPADEFETCHLFSIKVYGRGMWRISR